MRPTCAGGSHPDASPPMRGRVGRARHRARRGLLQRALAPPRRRTRVPHRPSSPALRFARASRWPPPLFLAMLKEAFDAFLADTYGIDGLNKLEVAHLARPSSRAQRGVSTGPGADFIRELRSSSLAHRAASGRERHRDYLPTSTSVVVLKKTRVAPFALRPLCNRGAQRGRFFPAHGPRRCLLLPSLCVRSCRHLVHQHDSAASSGAGRQCGDCIRRRHGAACCGHVCAGRRQCRPSEEGEPHHRGGKRRDSRPRRQWSHAGVDGRHLRASPAERDNSELGLHRRQCALRRRHIRLGFSVAREYP